MHSIITTTRRYWVCRLCCPSLLPTGTAYVRFTHISDNNDGLGRRSRLFATTSAEAVFHQEI